MGVLLQLSPKLHFPYRVPFQQADKFNGENRGTWYYRSVRTDDIRGPFPDEEHCEAMMNLEELLEEFPAFEDPDAPTPA